MIVPRGPLLEWTKIPNPQERLQYQCTEKLQQECDAWYLDNYMSWYVLFLASHEYNLTDQVSFYQKVRQRALRFCPMSDTLYKHMG